MEIIQNEEQLRQPCDPTTLEEGLVVLSQLEHTLSHHANGVGLAAPQIGIYKRVIYIKTPYDNIGLINPEILEYKHPFIFRNDGCLSFPGRYTDTYRYKEILVNDLIHPAGLVVNGLESVVIQHEVDHLNGVLFFDKTVKNIGRNDLCPCGSGKKFKKCHGM